MSYPRAAPIDTERLSIRPISRDDAKELFAILKGSDAELPFGDPLPSNLRETKKLVDFFAKGPKSAPEGVDWFALVGRTHDGELIGAMAVDIFPDDGVPTAYIDGFVAMDSRQHGYATEAGQAVVQHLLDRGLVVAANIRVGHPSEAVAKDIGLVETDELDGSARTWRSPT